MRPHEPLLRSSACTSTNSARRPSRSARGSPNAISSSPNGQGRPIRQDKTLAEFKAVQRAVGITPPRRLHDLRHTFATQLYARGVHPRAAQELLGHSRIEMTLDLYTGSVSDVLIDAGGLLDGTGFI
jgi:integrase